MRRKRVLFIILGLLFLVLLNLYLNEARTFFYSLSLPLQKVFWQSGNKLSDYLRAIWEIQGLKETNEELSSRVEELLAENAWLKELKKENEGLREALGLELQKEFELSLAQIVEKDIDQDFILIDKGRKKGILPNMPVITSEKVLLGKVSQVFEDFSKVMLISNKASSLGAKTQEGEVEGVVRGEGNLILSFELIDLQEEVKEGDVVVTSSLDKIFPKGLLIGRVKSIEKRDIEPFQKAHLEAAFNIKDLETLFIITSRQ